MLHRTLVGSPSMAFTTDKSYVRLGSGIETSSLPVFVQYAMGRNEASWNRKEAMCFTKGSSYCTLWMCGYFMK